MVDKVKKLKADGLKLKLATVDYDYLVSEAAKFDRKGKKQKADALYKLIQALDEKRAEGIDLTKEVLEETVNKIIDDNKALRKEYKKKMKELNQENQILSNYSQREMDELATAVVLINMSTQ